MDKGNYGLLAYQIDIEHVVKIVILLSSHCYQKNKKNVSSFKYCRYVHR